ncbi:hypothetical protein BDQ17DRAFT_393876 [Cyathus striatus]|nr:hypothetical protein BDQ17DRAFT_393876 [Cyathus striatus]
MPSYSRSIFNWDGFITARVWNSQIQHELSHELGWGRFSKVCVKSAFKMLDRVPGTGEWFKVSRSSWKRDLRAPYNYLGDGTAQVPLPAPTRSFYSNSMQLSASVSQKRENFFFGRRHKAPATPSFLENREAFKILADNSFRMEQRHHCMRLQRTVVVLCSVRRFSSVCSLTVCAKHIGRFDS